MANFEQKFREACKQSGLGSMLTQLNNPALNGLVSATLELLKKSMAGNTITGTIKTIGEKSNVSKQGNPFYKRELILDCSRYNPDDGTKIENYVQLNFIQNNCDALNGFAVGEKVEVKFKLSGREWQDKIINDIIGFGIERVAGAQAPQAPRAPQAPAPSPAASTAAPAAAPASDGTEGTQGDDLPF